jgi:hypothetical protein
MRVIYILLILFFYNSAKAQQHDNVWLLGTETISIGIKSSKLSFNSPTFIDSLTRNMPMFRSSLSMSDSLGNLLFYTNNIWIHNAQHQIMQNGDSLNPGPFADSYRNHGYMIPDGSISIPHPIFPNKYYLFHQSSSYSTALNGFAEKLYYSVIDMNANNGLGRVEKINKVLIEDDSICGGHLEIVKHGNGRDWWLVQPNSGQNGFHIFLITEDTIIKSHKQYIGNNNRQVGTEVAGQAVFSPDGTIYARYENYNDLDIFSFNRCSGLFSNYLHIPIVDTVDNMVAAGGGALNGIAISKNNRYLYIGSLIHVYQFDLFASNIPTSKDTVAILDTFMSASIPPYFGFLQLAPDGKIYSWAASSTHLHVIDRPDSSGLNSDVKQLGVNLHQHNGWVIPNFPHYRTPPLLGSPCDTLTKVKFIYEIDDINLKIYPNPVSHEITIELKKLNQDYEIEILDLAGRILLKRKTISSIFNLNIQNLENGVYICRAKGKNEILNQKFMIQR